MATQNSINANASTPLVATDGGTGLSNPTAHGILVGEGASAVNPIVLTNGQLLVGSTGADPVAASISAGSGITVTPGAGTITIAAVSTSEPWTVTSSTAVALVPNNGYITDAGSPTTFTLPTTAAVGTLIEIAGAAVSWAIAQNSGQNILFGNISTTPGVGGSITSQGTSDTMRLVCSVANNEFIVLSSVGMFSIV